MSKNCAIVLAAGRGTRMRAGVNKQFLNINGKPMLYYTLDAFSKSKLINEIVLVSSEEEMDYCRANIVDKYGFSKVSKIVAGGNERQHSVLNGLRAIEECDIVLIHDGARPFVSEAIIEDGIRYALLYGACTCGVNPKDTIKIKATDHFSIETLDRRILFSVQTPQCFKYDLILSCHEQLVKEDLNVTDDTMVVEKYGHRVYLYDGSYSNIKITTMEDLITAEKIAKDLQY